ncbi:HD-like signal output (HDOD) domain, no enzymatic activity [Amphritea atlantica]|uniref:HD-like signal output (HDOD) domain, no enzymatic activity n=1 Tax=Amphritea atlantica TaxID=355243 RepID=A0A1H9KGU7_9GAMM|nr:HDOD domain-containing protein [Amphritea atlantica]SEQ98318.1 HD-like signal output (HDOD) domain, no enzymatic activity [Amphritea atlantica]
MDEDRKRIFTLDFVKDRIDNLPLIPFVVEQLSTLSHDAIDFYSKVAELAEQDPPLAAKVLSAAHRVPCGPLKPVYNIEKALERMGVFNTLALMQELTAVPVFEPTSPGHKIGWRHSLETARFSRFLAQNTPGFNVSSDLAYMAGLLHDIGRFVLLQIAVKAVEVVDTKGWNSPEELSDVEQQTYGFTHAEVGYLAAQHWNLPRTLTSMLRLHHDYDLWRYDSVSVPFKQLLTIVQFADFLSVFLIKNPEWPAWSSTQLKGAICGFCIHKNWPEVDFPVDKLVAQLPAISEQCQAVLLKAGTA